MDTWHNKNHESLSICNKQHVSQRPHRLSIRFSQSKDLRVLHMHECMWRCLNSIEFGAILFGVGIGYTCAAAVRLFSTWHNIDVLTQFGHREATATANQDSSKTRIHTQLWYILLVDILLRLRGEKAIYITPRESIGITPLERVLESPRIQKVKPIPQRQTWERERERSLRKKNNYCNPFLQVNKTLLSLCTGRRQIVEPRKSSSLWSFIILLFVIKQACSLSGF